MYGSSPRSRLPKISYSSEESPPWLILYRRPIHTTFQKRYCSLVLIPNERVSFLSKIERRKRKGYLRIFMRYEGQRCTYWSQIFLVHLCEIFSGAVIIIIIWALLNKVTGRGRCGPYYLTFQVAFNFFFIFLLATVCPRQIAPMQQVHWLCATSVQPMLVYSSNTILNVLLPPLSGPNPR